MSGLHEKHGGHAAGRGERRDADELEVEGVAVVGRDEPDVSMQGDSNKCPKCSECVTATDKALQCELLCILVSH